MGSYPYAAPTTSGLVENTAVKSSYKVSIYNEVTGKHEEVEKTSTIAEYKGGSLLGWNLYAPEKTKAIIYDNIEKAEGSNYGLISVNKEESIRDWFGSNGLKFKNGLFLHYIEGKFELSSIYVDIE
jgi:hypothetical protein